MGMFDWFHPSNTQADKFICRKCECPIRHMQTKDFDCLMLGIHMKNDGSLEAGQDEEYEDEVGPGASPNHQGHSLRLCLLVVRPVQHLERMATARAQGQLSIYVGGSCPDWKRDDDAIVEGLGNWAEFVEK